ncbi:indolethylamine N-methyltransferase-like [Ascaphus truei]|uniref:indolethylamine N-methyltransferase-like n=1 Tax=Ascaphus truei TaxID=8439 RepID=UPI003F591A6F
MDSSLHKHYHDKEFDPKAYTEAFFCDETCPLIDESVGFPLKKLHEMFSSGRVRGDTLIDISAGPFIYHLLSACDIFKEIIVVEFTEPNIQEFEKWLKKDPGAADWSYAAKVLCELEGNREEWQVKEDKVRRAIKQVVKWDVSKDNSLDPVVLPQVDCVLSLWCLNKISRDKDAYRSNLRKFASLLNIGGHLLLFGVLNITYYKIGEHKFFALQFDEKFLREALRDAGYVIENLDLLPSKKSSDMIDYEHIVYVIARKEKIELTIDQLSLLNRGLGFAPVQNFQLFQTVIDLQKFTRKLSLSSRGVTVSTGTPVTGDISTDNFVKFDFQKQCVLSDMEDILVQQGEPLNASSQPFFGNQDSGLRKKSIFCPSSQRGPCITTFEKLVDRDIRLLDKGFSFSNVLSNNLTISEVKQLEVLKKDD